MARLPPRLMSSLPSGNGRADVGVTPQLRRDLRQEFNLVKALGEGW